MQNRFQADTSSYKLDVLFMDDKLKISLTDFVDGLKYYRQYDEEDIGKEINRKADLRDLYQSLVQSEKSNESGPKQLINYELGDIVQTNGSKCYKVEKGGKVTIYVIIKKANQELTLQSELNLQVKQKINDLEMEKHRISLNKKQQTNYLAKEVQEIKNDIQKMRNQFKELENRMMNKFNEIRQILVGKERGTAERDEEQQMIKSQKKLKQVQGIDMGFLTAISQVNLPNNGLNLFGNKLKFQIYCNLIEYIDQPGWTQLIFNEYIPFSQTFRFKIKIIKSQVKNIMIGVVDYMKQKDQRTSYESKNSICYYICGKGSIYSSQAYKSCSNGPLSNNQVIEVEVNRQSQKMSWKANGKQLGQITDRILSDKQRIFLPYVEMYSTKDIIQYMQK